MPRPAPCAPKPAPARVTARRIEDLKWFLLSTGGATVYDIAERFDVSVRTAIRWIRALDAAREPLYEQLDGRRKVWRLESNARRERFSLSTTQMVALWLSKSLFGFLSGTGFEDDMADLFARLEKQLKSRDAALAKNLDKKLWVLHDAPHDYADQAEATNAIVTALLKEERLEIVHGRRARRRKAFRFDPYTLLLYKQGLYVIGYSHHHNGVRTLALDEIVDVEWLRGDAFEYPARYHPSQVVGSAFGLISGPRTRVVIRFSDDVAPFIRRRVWHPSQELTDRPDGLHLTMEVEGTRELVSWVLQWGAQAELLEPASLVAQLADEVARMHERYAARAEGVPPPPK